MKSQKLPINSHIWFSAKCVVDAWGYWFYLTNIISQVLPLVDNAILVFLGIMIFILTPLLRCPRPPSILTLWGDVDRGGGVELGRRPSVDRLYSKLPLPPGCLQHPGQGGWHVLRGSYMRVFLLQSSQHILQRCQFLQIMCPWAIKITAPDRRVCGFYLSQRYRTGRWTSYHTRTLAPPPGPLVPTLNPLWPVPSPVAGASTSDPTSSSTSTAVTASTPTSWEPLVSTPLAVHILQCYRK